MMIMACRWFSEGGGGTLDIMVAIICGDKKRNDIISDPVDELFYALRHV